LLMKCRAARLDGRGLVWKQRAVFRSSCQVVFDILRSYAFTIEGQLTVTRLFIPGL
jgi:hypothetical protein